jgi:hypothetical protein
MGQLSVQLAQFFPAPHAGFSAETTGFGYPLAPRRCSFCRPIYACRHVYANRTNRDRNGAAVKQLPKGSFFIWRAELYRGVESHPALPVS